MKALRVGLVGYGYAGATFHAPLISSVDGLELVKIYSSRPTEIRAGIPETGLVGTPAALFAEPDIDLVVITSPNNVHAALAREALLADKHVVVEKPFVTRSADGEALIRLAHERGKILSVFHNRRWDGDFLTLKRLMAEGTLGEITSFESHFDRYRPEVKNRWRENDVDGGGLLYDLGPHLIDQCLQLFGKPQTIYADVQRQRASATAVDYFHLVFGYGSMRAILHAASLVRAPSTRFVVQGRRASFVKTGLDTQETALKRGEKPGASNWGRDDTDNYGKLFRGDEVAAEAIETLAGSYESYYRQLVAAIHERGPVPVSAEDANLAIRLIEIALQSAREQRTISLT